MPPTQLHPVGGNVDDDEAAQPPDSAEWRQVLETRVARVEAKVDMIPTMAANVAALLDRDQDERDYQRRWRERVVSCMETTSARLIAIVAEFLGSKLGKVAVIVALSAIWPATLPTAIQALDGMLSVPVAHAPAPRPPANANAEPDPGAEPEPDLPPLGD